MYNSGMEIKKLSEKKRFSIVARAKSFTYGFNGIKVLFKTTHNFWIHTVCAFMVILLGFLLKVSLIEWAILVLTIGFVLVIESINTAIEIDINLTSPNYHPYARDTKDVACGAVLISAITSVIIALIIFLPKIINIL